MFTSQARHSVDYLFVCVYALLFQSCQDVFLSSWVLTLVNVYVDLVVFTCIAGTS